MNHLKAMKAQIWRVELAFTPENGAITECPQSPGSADDHELEEDRQEIPPEQTQANTTGESTFGIWLFTV